jgi:hypothetical protein
MARNNKYPELQGKFELGLSNSMEAGKTYNGRSLLDLIIKDRLKLNIIDPEAEDLEKNFSNYIYRAAKENQVIISLGRKKGYQLNADLKPNKTNLASKVGEPERRNWESFLHFIATICLAKKFNSKVFSLPPKTTNRKWANPDMIMIRDNWFIKGSDIINFSKIISMVDSSPQFIMSSIELKFSIGSQRVNVLNALSETAINGGWANENWLAFMDTAETKTEFDSDALEFAKRNNIGIVEIFIDEDDFFDITIVLPLEKKNFLSLSSDFGEKRTPLLEKITSIIIDFEKNGTFRSEENGDYMHIAELLSQAYDNLKIQSGFTKDTITTLKEYLKIDKKIKNAILEILKEDMVFNETNSNKIFFDGISKEISRSQMKTHKTTDVTQVINAMK